MLTASRIAAAAASPVSSCSPSATQHGVAGQPLQRPGDQLHRDRRQSVAGTREDGEARPRQAQQPLDASARRRAAPRGRARAERQQPRARDDDHADRQRHRQRDRHPGQMAMGERHGGERDDARINSASRLISVCENTVPATTASSCRREPSRRRVTTMTREASPSLPGKTAEAITPIIVARVTGASSIRDVRQRRLQHLAPGDRAEHQRGRHQRDRQHDPAWAGP